jgi:hypothetical protein
MPFLHPGPKPDPKPSANAMRDGLVKSDAYLKLYQAGLLDLDLTISPKRAKITAQAMLEMAKLIDGLRAENERLRVALEERGGVNGGTKERLPSRKTVFERARAWFSR